MVIIAAQLRSNFQRNQNLCSARIQILQSRHGHLSVVRVLILFLKIDNAFTSLIESGTSSHIFGAKDKRLPIP